ncbi:MAG: alpha/beta hydrolase [Desulfobacterales bacterium]|jgi:pimeloyl-ACP methyl ester carboxylesterase|nr:alpha/beta hydrolase [Desulfobacterales bacterium]MBT7698187.1 alpha/beta hydrolase [Desulfobacterales bacterium]
MKLIFIHGSGGSKESWYYQTKHFTSSEAIDLPGHPIGEPSSSIEGYVDWLHGYICDRGYKDIVLAGHSLGGGIVLLYAIKYPQNIKGIIPVGSGAKLRVHPMYLEALEKAIADPELLEDFPDPTYDLINLELVKTLRRRALENGPGVTLNDMLACDKFNIIDRLSEIQVPTLAICGTEDLMTPPKYSDYLVDKINDCRSLIIPGGTHYVFAEKPDEVNKAIEDFINDP